MKRDIEQSAEMRRRYALDVALHVLGFDILFCREPRRPRHVGCTAHKHNPSYLMDITLPLTLTLLFKFITFILKISVLIYYPDLCMTEIVHFLVLKNDYTASS